MINSWQYFMYFFCDLNLLDDAVASHDLLKAIEIPFRDVSTIQFGLGADGFPVFVLSAGHDIQVRDPYIDPPVP